MPTRRSLVTDNLLDAIAMAESSGGKHVLGDTALANPAYGTFQIRLPAYQDVQRLYPQEFGQVPFEQVQQDQHLNRRVAQRYLQALEQTYGLSDFDQMVAAYNAGPTAIRKATRTGRPLPNPEYVEKVKRFLKRGKPRAARPDQGDPVEQGLRRINRLAVATGFMPMTAPEIERILARETVPSAVPGVIPQSPDPLEQERQAIAATHQALRGQRRVGPGAAVGGLV